MPQLPKSLIKKHRGDLKAAWAEFRQRRGQKGTKKKASNSGGKKTTKKAKANWTVKKIISLDAVNFFFTGQHIPDSLVNQMSEDYSTLGEVLGQAPEAPMYARVTYSYYATHPREAMDFLKTGVTGHEADQEGAPPRFIASAGEVIGFKLFAWGLGKLALKREANSLLKEVGVTLGA